MLSVRFHFNHQRASLIAFMDALRRFLLLQLQLQLQDTPIFFVTFFVGMCSFH